MSVEVLVSPSAPPALGPYSHAVRAGDFIVLAGQLGIDPSTGVMADGVEAQSRQALSNIAAILADHGRTMGDVAKATVFLVDLSEFPLMNAEYGAAFGDHKPARSTVQVGLPAGGRVEIEVWAYVG